nr:MAG TPA: hypothetical protein [Caudoviricetes sp.]
MFLKCSNYGRKVLFSGVFNRFSVLKLAPGVGYGLAKANR